MQRCQAKVTCWVTPTAGIISLHKHSGLMVRLRDYGCLTCRDSAWDMSAPKGSRLGPLCITVSYVGDFYMQRWVESNSWFKTVKGTDTLWRQIFYPILVTHHIPVGSTEESVFLPRIDLEFLQITLGIAIVHTSELWSMVEANHVLHSCVSSKFEIFKLIKSKCCYFALTDCLAFELILEAYERHFSLVIIPLSLSFVWPLQAPLLLACLVVSGSWSIDILALWFNLVFLWQSCRKHAF